MDENCSQFSTNDYFYIFWKIDYHDRKLYEVALATIMKITKTLVSPALVGDK